MNVLFDEPGPRARRRIRVATVVSVLAGALLVALAVRQFAINGELDWKKWAPYTQWPNWRYLLTALGQTLLAAGLSAGLGGLAGLLLAVARVSRNVVVSGFARAYMETVRVIPAVLLIYVVLFVLPSLGLDLPLLWKLVVPLAVSSSAQFGEIFRAGILSLDRGQGEAAAALGLNNGQAMRLVILPQALRRVVPSLVSQTGGVLKDTSLGFFVSYAELLFSGKVLIGYYQNQLLIQTYLVIGAIYFTANYALSRFARWLERRGNSNRPPLGHYPGHR
ncbi:amino acid ABC transporter permease [Amycolatopsis magusensis]|uniref:Glutamate transport system permease protein n=1 Tax=Amycolatopsis magusensis TaxID=882444 RepID=A0ABS4PLN2_9PSEU|nr:amino acid ABC transporter permease [Amycolatopsis magusensis]MBP2179753.1 glutamate transport system permease protein [Amycolatopsis magusensis]